MGKEILRNGGGNHGEGQGANRTQGLTGRRGEAGCRAKGRGEGQGAQCEKAGYYARFVDVKKPCNRGALMGYLIAARVIFCTS